MRFDHLLFAASLAVCSSLAGCESPPKGGPDMSGGGSVVSPEQACPALIKAYCAKATDCMPFNQALGFPDAATCEARLNLTCPQLAKAMGTSVTGDDLQACSAKFSSISCYDYLSLSNPVQVCDFKPGKLTDGSACGEGVQCQSLYCKKDSTMDCGKCTALGKSGSVCVTNSDCDKGLACVGAAGAKQCTAYLTMGASCSTAANSPSCHPTLACRNGVCATPAKLGESCSATTQDCDKLSGLTCPLALKCVGYATAQLGGACGQQGSTYVLCAGGSWCDSTSKKCMAPAPDGMACSDATGPKCQAPANCRAGICKIADSATCM